MWAFEYEESVRKGVWATVLSRLKILSTYTGNFERIVKP